MTALKILMWPWRLAHWMLYARPIHFTRFGIYYILFSLGVGAAAINTGNNLLYLILGILLGLIVVSGFLSDSCLWGAATQWVSTGDLYAGQPMDIDVTLHKTWFPGISISLTADWTVLEKTHHFFYWVPRHGKNTQRFSMTPRRRGYLELESVHYSTRFPFGLFSKTHHEPLEQKWIVLPAIEKLPFKLLEAADTVAHEFSRPYPGIGASPLDLRNYQHGDSARRIHWKTSARRGRWMVMNMEEETALARMVAVSQWPSELSSEAQEDRFINFLASLMFTLYEVNRPVGLMTPGVVYRPQLSRDHLYSILRYLALVNIAQESRLPLRIPSRETPFIDAVNLWRNR